jgi:hypothetical protein
MSMGSKPLDFSAQLKFNLKTNSAFKEALQRRLRTSTAAFVEHVRGYFRDCLTLIGKQLGADLPVVVIVDSLEHLRGELAAEEQVQQSVATLFSSNVAALRMPQLHMIYTVPLYLRIREPAVVQQYGSRFHFLPAISLWERGSRHRADAAFDVCERVVARRGDWLRLLGHRDVPSSRGSREARGLSQELVRAARTPSAP